MISACDPHHSIRPGSYSSSVKQSSSRCTTVRLRRPFPSFERRILVVAVSLASLASIRNTSTTSEPCRNHQYHPSLILWSPILAHQMPSTKPRDPHIPSALYHEYQRSPNIMPAYFVAHAIHLRRTITQAYSRISSLPRLAFLPAQRRFPSSPCSSKRLSSLYQVFQGESIRILRILPATSDYLTPIITVIITSSAKLSEPSPITLLYTGPPVPAKVYVEA
jgi:hypothetical protein